VALYSRRQLLLLLVLIAVAGAGLAIDRWRHAYPELADRLERADLEPEVRGGDAAGPPPTRGAAGRARAPAHAAFPLAHAGGRRQRLTESPGAPVDLNRAGPEDLQRLPGVGPVLAQRIVEARETLGPFESVDDLRRVRGVGPVKLDRLRPYLTTGAGPPPDP
jgi:competence ComEA-like helix-hairpin-helix protein